MRAVLTGPATGRERGLLRRERDLPQDPVRVSALGPDRIEVNYKIRKKIRSTARTTRLSPGTADAAAADPESSLVGQSYVCSFARTSDDRDRSGNWIWAGSGVHRASHCPG